MSDSPKPCVADTVPKRVEVEAGKDYWWCTCGRSKNQPFCDGSHKTTEFTPLKWTGDVTGPKWFCQCKYTKNAPFCDGSHSNLPADACYLKDIEDI